MSRRPTRRSAAASRRAFCAARRPSASSRKCRRICAKPSAYADRGTALHAAMVLLLDDSGHSLDSLVGKTLNNYTITSDDVENALRPAYAYVDALLDAPGAEFFLEQRVEFPTIAGAFGTCDLIVRIGSTVHVSISNLAAACASSRFTLTATRMSSTRNCCSTPPPRATR